MPVKRTTFRKHRFGNPVDFQGSDTIRVINSEK
jgi:hypothetical protein